MNVVTPIYDYFSYKDFLNELCQSERGLLTRLAEAAPCQKSYLSGVLKGKMQLTLDHVFGICQFLECTDDEEDYFFLLLEKDRASSHLLKKKLDKKIRSFSSQQYKLKNQNIAQVVQHEQNSDLNIYYSNWIYTAMHIFTSVGKFQTIAALAKRMQLDAEVIKVHLDYLVQSGFVEKKGEQYKWGSVDLHLPDNSYWISNHHLNWRLKAMEDFQKRKPESLHYTMIQSLSEEDFEKLKKKIVHFLKDFAKVADPSTPEEVFNFNIDFFKI